MVLWGWVKRRVVRSQGNGVARLTSLQRLGKRVYEGRTWTIAL